MHHLGPLVDELQKRGYDLKTLKFSIRKNPAQRDEGESR